MIQSFLLIMILVFISPFGVKGVKVGDKVCVEGIPMDYFCINDGFLMDNPSVITLKEPIKHSVHCMIDIPVCVKSPFEILTPPTMGGKLYKRAYRLNDSTKSKLVKLAKKVGECSTCSGTGTIKTGLKVVVKGKILYLATSKRPAIIHGNVTLSKAGTPGC
jgi:hypothetical protein